MEGLMIQDISKIFTGAGGEFRTVLKNVSLHLPPKNCISIVGESGCGKSTLMKIALGIMPPSAGDVFLDGESVIGLSNRQWLKKRSVLQGVFQDAKGSLNEYLSTYANSEEALRNLTSLSRDQRRGQIEALMEGLNIDRKLLKTRVHRLSGGEQRRIALMRALAVNPKYLLMDEVMSGLDALNQDAVMRTLEAYKTQFDCAYLLITHDMNIAYRLSDVIIHMDGGRIKKIGLKNRMEEKNEKK